MEGKEKEKWLEAGRIGAELRKHGVSLAKPGASLLSIAKEIEKKALDLGAKMAFPPNLSINQIAAHYTPKYDDPATLKKGDILKIDVGASLDGFLSDTAATVAVGAEENGLIRATREALDAALKVVRPSMPINELSTVIEKRMRDGGFSPIVNLGGHGIKRYEIHEGEFIANVSSETGKTLRSEGVIAIEPFATTGGGYVIDSSEVQILMLEHKKPVRNRLGRDILAFVEKEYSTLPFAKRWVIDRFGRFAELELKTLVSAGALYEFNVLKERDDGMVAQFEHTVLFDKGETVVTTL